MLGGSIRCAWCGLAAVFVSGPDVDAWLSARVEADIADNAARGSQVAESPPAVSRGYARPDRAMCRLSSTTPRAAVITPIYWISPRPWGGSHLLGTLLADGGRVVVHNIPRTPEPRLPSCCVPLISLSRTCTARSRGAADSPMCSMPLQAGRLPLTPPGLKHYQSLRGSGLEPFTT